MVSPMTTHLAEMRGCSQRAEAVHWCDRHKKGREKQSDHLYGDPQTFRALNECVRFFLSHKRPDNLKMKMASGQTPHLTGQSAMDTCVQTFAKLCFTSQRVQCGCLPLPSQQPGPDFHGGRTKNQLHYSYNTRYYGSQGLYPVENTT